MLIADALILIWDRTAVALQLLGRNVLHLIIGLAGSTRTLVWVSGREFLA